MFCSLLVGVKRYSGVILVFGDVYISVYCIYIILDIISNLHGVHVILVSDYL